MNELTSAPAHDTEWERLRPVIDGAMDELRDGDREAVLLRFFEGKTFGEIAAKLRLTENAARMRVERALETLEVKLARRGITSTAAALGGVLGGQGAVAAPAGLAASVTSGALAGAASGGGWSAGLKLALGTTVVVGIVGAGILVQQERVIRAWRAERATHESGAEAAELARLTEENRRLANVAAEVAILRQDDAELARLRDEAARLSARLRREQPVAVVSPSRTEASGSGEVTVAGQIRRPGRVVLKEGQPVTLAAIVAEAGGCLELAKIQGVRVTRRQPDGSTKAEVCDLTGGGGNFALQAGDIVYVPERIQ